MYKNQITYRIEAIDWEDVREQMNHKGFTIVSKFLTNEECDSFKENYSKPNLYRKTVIMERHRFGLGEYKYFDYPLPELLQELRTECYGKLAPIANLWFQVLQSSYSFPLNHEELLRDCRTNNQTKATALILRYNKGGYNTLHQDIYGEVYFPIQVVLFLSDPILDYEGGEFILTEQVPRAQSKVTVLKPKKGDLLIFTTNFRPVKGTRGYYRVHMKHGVSEVRSGNRYTLGVIFHDAIS